MDVEDGSEPKRQKVEENMYDNDESVPIVERLKSIREDISNCFNKWKELDHEQRMETVDDVFNKVEDRLDNFVFDLPSGGITQPFLEEYNQLKVLTCSMLKEHKAFMLAHRRKCMGTEFHTRLLKLNKIEKKTKKLLHEHSNRPNDIFIYSLLSELPDVLDENQLADDNEADENDCFVIREEIVGMINCFDKGREVANPLYNLISRLRVEFRIMDAMISKMKKRMREEEFVASDLL